MTLKHILTTILILLVALFYSNTNNSDCLYIRGGGFSGFWYYYGYLQKNTNKTIKTNKTNKTIYCYSSGCLAYVASLTHNNSTHLYELVNTLAIDYNNNKLTNYTVKDQFINSISSKLSNNNIQNYNLNILTTNYLGQCIIKQPKTISELINYLDETSNIPLITTKPDLYKNLDGGLCFILNFNNYCATHIMLPFNFKFLTNVFNSNLSIADVSYFMDYEKN
jgi:hypothetical protein